MFGELPPNPVFNYIFAFFFRSHGITVGILLITLVVGINTPDIEKVLSLVGSTIGNVVCILIPSVIFIKLTEKNTTERLGAKVCNFNCRVSDLFENVDL